MAVREETTLADIIRKASEFYLSLYPENQTTGAREWDIPKPEYLGKFLSTDEDWRIMANPDRVT